MEPWHLVIWAFWGGLASIVFAFLFGIAWLIIKTVKEK